MARYRVLHGSIKTAGGFVAAGGFVELSESEAALIGGVELVQDPLPEVPAPAVDLKPKGKTK